MNNKELAKKIVEAVNEESSNYDAIDRVEEILNTIIKIKEPAEVESSVDGVWVVYVAGSMEYKQVGTASTERGAYVKLAERWGMDYETELLNYIEENEGGTEEDFREELCEDGEGRVEYISLKDE
jgi:hypothetical protein